MTRTEALAIAQLIVVEWFAEYESRPRLVDSIAQAILDAVSEEREQCAKQVEQTPESVLAFYSRGPNSPPGNCRVEIKGQGILAQAIRQRGEPEHGDQG